MWAWIQVAYKWVKDKLSNKTVSQSGSGNVAGKISGNATGIVASSVAIHINSPTPEKKQWKLSNHEIDIIQVVDQSKSGALEVSAKGGKPVLRVDGKDIARGPEHAVQLYDAMNKLIAIDFLSDLGRGGSLYLTPSGREAAGELREQLDRGERPDIAGIERMMPDLLKEMRQDFGNNPEIRELVVMDSEGNIYNGDSVFIYYRSVHPKLDSFLKILANNGLLHDITYNTVDRYSITEQFVRYVTE